jgi:hypothetical protein
VPEPAPKLKIVGETPSAQCRIAEAGGYTYIEQNSSKNYTGRLIIDGWLYTVSEATKRFGVN